jgi:Cu/Ag efflux pump CusA
MRDRRDLREAIVEGAAHRIRPKHMTVLAILFGCCRSCGDTARART